MNIRRRKLKPFVVPMIYALTLILLVGSVYLVQDSINNKSFTKNEVNNNSSDYVDEVIYDDRDVDIPVVSTDTQIIRPYSNGDVKIVNNYYDYKANNEEQENSILYYQDTYIQNSGLDYAMEDKSVFDVISILDGTVTSVTDDDILGTIVEIKYSNDLTAVYQSLSEVSVKANDNVIQGSVIGKSGESNIGADLGSHLHFELYYQGLVVNPEEYFGKLLGEIQAVKPSFFLNCEYTIKGITMNKKIIERVFNESRYILNTKKTVREIAKVFDVSKSTVHKDLTERLLEIDNNLYLEVSKILKYHLDVRHIRGGESTRRKFLEKNAN